MVTIQTICPHCGKVTYLDVPFLNYLAYMEGEPIHECFPELSADEREMLISGVCPTCWDEMFPPEEEEDFEEEVI